MINTHLKGINQFNFGLGIIHLKESEDYLHDGKFIEFKDWKRYTMVNLSYRHQPKEGGLFFSAGINAIYIFPTIYVSLGYCF